MQTGPDSVGGNIDGGTGSDTIVYSGGAWAQNHAKVVSFEEFVINATHDLVLEGEWRIDNRIAQIDGGSLTVQNLLASTGDPYLLLSDTPETQQTKYLMSLSPPFSFASAPFSPSGP
ncbi:hypothetical protein [Dethiosulfatarculus sandiegensis]|uniref:Uncharacterized protein n=1 Tax=Dethiosulfatarculus sandiegensis TaxID=1429043 RepID=A0A0D2J892_9BACT|nr:hypothetical protein [Dethiosulfatarculus sandiegensis]KIX14394.1 hypothetical protein X474_09455 [Dethiosulfatarculus sandiegensis]